MLGTRDFRSVCLIWGESVLGGMRLLAGMLKSWLVGDDVVITWSVVVCDVLGLLDASATRSVVGDETAVGVTSVWVEAARNLDLGTCENLLAR